MEAVINLIKEGTLTGEQVRNIADFVSVKVAEAGDESPVSADDLDSFLLFAKAMDKIPA